MLLTEDTVKKVEGLIDKSVGSVGKAADMMGSAVSSAGKSVDLIDKSVGAMDKAIDVPLGLVNKPIDYADQNLKKIGPVKKVLDHFGADPTQSSRSRNAKEWAALMGGGSLLMHAPQLLSGDPTQMATAGAVAAGNALKGTAIGPMMVGGKDTLLKASLIPAGVTAALTKPINDIGTEYFGTDDDIDFNSTARGGFAAALGAGMWALRNRNKKAEDRHYV